MTSTRIGVDIGGTFTDLLCYDDTTGEILVGKVPTTPAAPEGGALNAIETAVPEKLLKEAGHFLHGTTVGLNALLERRGAKVGLLTTEGFRDVIEVRRGSRDDMYNAFWRPPAPLVDRQVRIGIKERVDHNGNVRVDLDEAEVKDALELLVSEGVTAIAVAFLHAYANPSHELRVRELIEQSGFDGAISLSHEVSGEYRNYERTVTTIVDAFVQARLSGYLTGIEDSLKGSGFKGECLITRSGSGSMTFSEALGRPFETIMSGPVAGAEGGASLSRNAGLGDLVTADVGGTSFDTALIRDGRPQLLYQGEIEGLPIQSPWVDVRSIGAGGGSIAFVDEGGLLQVGPRSSGADPGPACYGWGGTEPTTSDAAFYLGMLGDGKLASGLVLDRSLAEKALKTVADKLGYTVDQTAQGIIAIASAAMAGAIRDITVEQGVDPRDLSILAFGGAGPLLATELARELDIEKVIIPPFAGNFSAWGLLGASLLRSQARSKIVAFTDEALGECAENMNALVEDLFARGGKSENRSNWTVEGSLDLRYYGQEHSLSIPVALDGAYKITTSLVDIQKTFEENYIRVYGEKLDMRIEIVAVRAALRQELPARKPLPASDKADASYAPEYDKKAYSFSRGEFMNFAYVDRECLANGAVLAGPAILLEQTATTYVDADFQIEVDESGCLILRRVE